MSKCFKVKFITDDIIEANTKKDAVNILKQTRLLHYAEEVTDEEIVSVEEVDEDE